MAQYVAIRALNRSSNVRVLDKDGAEAKLSTDTGTVVDLDLASNRRRLSRHGAIGQWVVIAANATYGASGSKSSLPANS